MAPSQIHPRIKYNGQTNEQFRKKDNGNHTPKKHASGRPVKIVIFCFYTFVFDHFAVCDL
uniref:Uncharacterized protein n=1 Tax=Anguilla anguilla TaxID=7936 RepID=A0A0E9V0F7_ANGAN